MIDLKEWSFDDARTVSAAATKYDVAMAEWKKACEDAEAKGAEPPARPNLKEPNRPPGFHYHSQDAQGRPRLFEVHANGARRDEVTSAIVAHVANNRNPPRPTYPTQTSTANEW